MTSACGVGSWHPIVGGVLRVGARMAVVGLLIPGELANASNQVGGVSPGDRSSRQTGRALDVG